MDYPKYGDTLKNGAKVLACHPRYVRPGRAREAFVLADTGDQLVTWEIIDKGDFWLCQGGVYFQYPHFLHAVGDYCDRTGLRVSLGD